MKTKDNEICISVSHSREIAIGSPLHIEVIVNTSIWKSNYCKVLFNRFMEAPSIVRDLSVKFEGDNIKVYSLDISFGQLGNYYFFFLINLNGEEKALKLNKTKSEVLVTNQYEEFPYWKILVINNDFKTDDKFKDRRVYQFLVGRFHPEEENKVERPRQPGRNYREFGHMVNWHRDSSGEFHNNDFFCGTIKGATEKIPYLVELGIGIAYMSPINYSIIRDDRYAATDHLQIDPDVGTFEDLKEFYETCHKNGILVILDIALNHCHVSNPMYQDAISNPDSPYREWFRWNSDGTPECWFGYTDMPQFNQECKAYQEYVKKVITTFAPYNDGFRLDLFEVLHYPTRVIVKKEANLFGPHIIYGEHWAHPHISEFGEQFDAHTCYTIANALYKYILFGYCDILSSELQYILDNFPQDVLDTMLFSLDTHDIIRERTIFAKKRFMQSDHRRVWDIDYEPSPWHRNGKFYTDEFREFEFSNDELTPEESDISRRMMKIAAIVQYFLIGNACVYYGTEAGIYGWKDPFSKKCYPWGHEDIDLVNYYKALGQFRNRFDAIDSNPVITHFDEELLVFNRRNVKNKVFVAINRSEYNPRRIDIPEEFRDGEYFTVNYDNDVLYPYGGIVILKK